MTSSGAMSGAGRLIARPALSSSLMPLQPHFARAWLRQREAGDRQVAKIERDELGRLDAARALWLADALLAATPLDAIAATRRTSSGFVEQQRLFQRIRR